MASGAPAGVSGRSALAVAENAARAAGALLRKRFVETTGADAAGTLQVAFKGRNNLVTEADHAAEALLLDVLRKEFPHHGVLAEESGRIPPVGRSTEPTRDADGSEYTWILDPLDGTRNFASGMPHFAVNIALTRGDELALGVTYDPMRDELFTAQAGGGATLNGRRIAVTGQALADSVLGFDMGYVDERGRHLLELIQRLWPGMQTVRLMGSAALGFAWAAAGRLQLYAHHHVQPWDIAPGLLLVREAGGVVTDVHGEPARLTDGQVIAGGPAVHAAFMAATAGTTWRTAGMPDGDPRHASR